MSTEGTKIGKVLPMPKGLYDSDTEYLYLDIVRYEGASYICKEACTGKLPTNVNYWQMISKDGNVGYFESGDSLNISSMTEADEVGQIVSDELPDTMFNKITTMIKNVRWLISQNSEVKTKLTTFNGVAGGDEWTAKSYTKGNTVIYNNKVYLCKANCTSSNLPTDTNYWEETSLKSLNDTLSNLPQIENGSIISGTLNGSTTTTLSVLFANQFAKVPTINVTICQNSSAFNLYVREITVNETGFAINIQNLNSSQIVLTNVRKINWIAIG